MAENGKRIAKASGGKIYHGVYPGINNGVGDDITVESLVEYLLAVQKRVAWIYFSNEWCRCRAFPWQIAAGIASAGAVPFIRLMLRSAVLNATKYQEGVYTLINALRGDFYNDLRKWARHARGFGHPLLVEFGTECNGEWFPWNATYNGKDTKIKCPDKIERTGAEQFAAVFRYIVNLRGDEGADNITWVFHVNGTDGPCAPWNKLEQYYPGDDVVDWLAMSCYGAQSPSDTDRPIDFATQMDSVYKRLTALAPRKPIVVAEFGCTIWKGAGVTLKAEDWAKPALQELINLNEQTHVPHWPAVIGFSWWNDYWTNDPDPPSDMLVQDNPALASVFRQFLINPRVADRPETV